MEILWGRDMKEWDEVPATDMQSLSDVIRPFVNAAIDKEKCRIEGEIIDVLDYMRQEHTCKITNYQSDAQYFFHLGRSLLITEIIKTIRTLLK
jgi:hypothetical protein